MRKKASGGHSSRVSDALEPAIQKPLIVHFQGQTRAVHWKAGERVRVDIGTFSFELEFPEGEQSGPNLNGPWYWVISHESANGDLGLTRLRAMDRDNARRLFLARSTDDVKILEINRE